MATKKKNTPSKKTTKKTTKKAPKKAAKKSVRKAVTKAAAPTPPAPVAESAPAARRRLREEAQRAREEAAKNPPAAVAPPAPATNIAEKRAEKGNLKAVKEQKSLVLQLTELQKFKLEALDLRVKAATAAISAPILKAAEAQIRTSIARASERDPVCRDAQREQAIYANEVLKDLSVQLPVGYACTLLSHEQGTALAEYSPEQVGKLLPVPEPLAVSTKE